MKLPEAYILSLAKGITLVEVIIIITIFTLLIGISLPLTLDFYHEREFDVHFKNIVQALRRAQLRAMSAEGDSSFGVYFEENKYILFKGDFYYQPPPDPPWYDSDWLYRKRITIEHEKVSADLQNFPVLISVTDPDLSKAQTDGDDILFTASDGATKFDHEIEKFANSTGELVVHIRIPSLSSTTDTEVYMYYGNASTANQENVAGVWDSNYKGVWHLSHDDTASGTDSTLYNNDGDVQNGASTIDSAQIDGGMQFDGINDVVNAGGDDSLNIRTSLTMEAWVNATAYNNDWNDVMSKDDYDMYIEGGKLCPYFHTDGGKYDACPGSVRMVVDTWYHIVVTYDEGAIRGYIDGVLDGTASKGTIIDDSSGFNFLIGYYEIVEGIYWQGIIDEVRVSNIARSDEWILTEYRNQSDPSSFYTISAEETSGNDGPAWYDQNWSYRKKITILASQVTADLPDFPVLISVTDPDLSKAQTDGDDILFTSSDGIVKLSHEIEDFDYPATKLVSWVNIPSLSSTQDTEIYMYYGNSGALNQQNPIQVWNSNYMGVWHLGESSGTRFDSANNNDLSESGTVSYSTNGKFGNALDLDISPEGSVYITDNASLSITGNMTISAWVNMESLPSVNDDDMAVVSKWASDNYSYYLFLEESGDPQDRLRFYVNEEDNSDTHDAEGGTSLSMATWHYIVLVNNGTDFRLYLSGILDVSSDNPESHTEGIYDGGAEFHIGRRSDGSDEMDGLIDEVRVSNIARSDEWILTSYNNQNNPSTFYIIESEETESKDTSYDETFEMPENFSLSGISEVVFNKLTGIPSNTGDIILTGHGRSETININEIGKVEY